MIVGTGIDLAEIGRIQHSIERYGPRFLDRVYTPAEQAYCLRKRNSAESFAARFAAKEAGAKALGTGISHGVKLAGDRGGARARRKAHTRFHGRAAQIAARLGVAHTALSITHTADAGHGQRRRSKTGDPDSSSPSAILKANQPAHSSRE